MKGFLLDTNICIFAMRDKYGVNERLESIDPQQCFITLFQLQSCGSWTSQVAKPSEARAVMLVSMA